MQLLRSKLTLAVASVFVLLFGVVMARTYVRERVVRHDVERLRMRIADADAKNRELAQLIERFAKPSEVEKEARVRLNLKKSDEEVLVIPLASPTATAATFVATQKTTLSFAPITNFLRSLFGIEKTRE